MFESSHVTEMLCFMMNVYLMYLHWSEKAAWLTALCSLEKAVNLTSFTISSEDKAVNLTAFMYQCIYGRLRLLWFATSSKVHNVTPVAPFTNMA